jgi:hypothetical protein
VLGHESQKALAVSRFEEMYHLVDYYILQEISRFLYELRIASNGGRTAATASPLRFHPPKEIALDPSPKR